jgi:hypothetical protein
MPDSPAARALREASAGLTYPSDTDAPWTAFTWPEANGTPTADQVKRYGRLKPNTPVRLSSIDELFGPLVQEQDWFGEQEKADAAKYRSLADAVKKNLLEPIVVRAGRRKVAVYVVGRDPAGGWSGLQTMSVET